MKMPRKRKLFSSKEEKINKFINSVDKVYEPTIKNSKPWEFFDPKDAPSKAINLRINNYEHALLSYIAKKEKRSIQKHLKHILLKSLHNALRKKDD